MSNTIRINPAAPIRGDMGLGLCLACVKDHMKAAADAAAARAEGLPFPDSKIKQPHFAITTAPSTVPVPGPDGLPAGMAVVPVPSCYDHLIVTRPAAPAGSGLLLPGGR